MMTLAQFVDSVCISIGDFSTATKNRIKTLIPSSVQHIMDKATWEFRIRYKELTTSATDEWVEFPDEYDKEIVLWYDDYEGELEYISPREYGRRLAADSTPYGTEACKYTVVGAETPGKKQFRFLDKPTSAFTIKGFFTIKIDPSAIQILPESFYEAVKSHVIYRLTPPVLETGGGLKMHNPSFVTARFDYDRNIQDLKAKEAAKPGRMEKVKLDKTAQRAYDHFHK